MNTMEKAYTSPVTEYLEYQNEGILCASNERLQENIGNW